MFGFLERLTGYALTPAHLEGAGDSETLVSEAGEVTLVGGNLSLLIRGQAGSAAELLFTPTVDGSEGIVAFSLLPPTVLLGASGFGLDVAGGIVLDSTEVAAAPGATQIQGATLSIAADAPAWKGLLIRNARLFLPPGVPLIGGRALETYLAIGDTPPGIDFAVDTVAPAQGSRPEIRAHIECRDPAARGLAGFLPTLVEASVTLPLDGREEVFNAASGAGVRLASGRPLIATVRLSRQPDAAPPTTRVSLALEAQGDAGIVTIDAKSGGVRRTGRGRGRGAGYGVDRR